MRFSAALRDNYKLINIKYMIYADSGKYTILWKHGRAENSTATGEIKFKKCFLQEMISSWILNNEPDSDPQFFCFPDQLVYPDPLW